MDRLIDTQMNNIQKAYDSIPMGGKLEFSKSAIEGLYQVLKELKEYKDLEENGLLIKLPCKIGDVVNVVNEDDEVINMTVSNVYPFGESDFDCESQLPFVYNVYLEDEDGNELYLSFEDFNYKLKESD